MTEIMYRCHGCENYCSIIVHDRVKPKVCIKGEDKQKWTRFKDWHDIKLVGDD